MTISVYSIRPCVPRVPYLDSMISCRLASISWVLGNSDSGRLFGRDLTAAVAQSGVSVVWALSNLELSSLCFLFLSPPSQLPSPMDDSEDGESSKGSGEEYSGSGSDSDSRSGSSNSTSDLAFPELITIARLVCFSITIPPIHPIRLPIINVGPIMECSI